MSTNHFDNKDKLQFKDLTKEQRSILVEAWFAGKLQFLSKQGNWFRQDLEDGLWDSGTYRTQPARLDIPWDLIDKKWQWAAMDQSGSIYFYTLEPTRLMEHWASSTLGSSCPSALAISTVGVNWESSIQRRP